MLVTVSAVSAPKPGKRNGSIKCGEEWYSYDPSKLTFDKGQSYEIEVKGSDYEGKMFYFVQSAKPINMPAGTRTQAPSGNGTAPPQSDRFWLPFVSNTVAHALSSGLIKEPYQVKQWAAAAKQSAMELDGQREPGSDFDDFDDGRPI